MLENADGSLSPFSYYFAQREAVESVIWLHEVRRARDKFDLLRFDASGSVSRGMFDEDWPCYVLKMATGAGKFPGCGREFHRIQGMSMQYIQRMKQRDPELKKGWGRITTPLSEALKGGGQSVPPWPAV